MTTLLYVLALTINTVENVPSSYFIERMPRRYQRALAYLRREDRLRCLGAGLLTMRALGLRDERDIRISEHGKPYLANGPEFSLSHSGAYAVVAVDASPLGVDIEVIDPTHLSLAESVYNTDELAWMRGSPLERFHALWTIKESVMKATGMGLSVTPKSICVPPDKEPAVIRLGEDVWYSRWTSYQNHALAYASHADMGDIKLHIVSAESLIS